MSVLNLTFPNILSIQYRYLLLKGPTTRDELTDLCAPKSVVSNRQNFNNTLRLAIRLGLFVTDEGKLRISPELPKDALSKRKGEALLPVVICESLMSKSVNEPLWKGGEEEDADSDDADFTRAVSWALALNFPDMPNSGPTAEKLLRSQVSGTDPLQIIQNTGTRWPGFVRWAPFLGFGWGNFVSDPTEAIRQRLSAVFGRKRTLPANELISKLSEALPVLDGGTYRIEVESKLDVATAWSPPPEGALSSSLSLALMRLHLDGTLSLDHKSDSPSVVRLHPYLKDDIMYRQFISDVTYTPGGRK